MDNVVGSATTAFVVELEPCAAADMMKSALVKGGFDSDFEKTVKKDDLKTSGVLMDVNKLDPRV